VQRVAIRLERTRAVVANVSASRTKIYPALSVITSRSFPPFVKANLPYVHPRCCSSRAECRPGEKTEESQRFSDPKLRAHVGTAIGTLVACNKRLRGDCLRRIDERSPLARAGNRTRPGARIGAISPRCTRNSFVNRACILHALSSSCPEED